MHAFYFKVATPLSPSTSEIILQGNTVTDCYEQFVYNSTDKSLSDQIGGGVYYF